jgi:hypothetical protein
MLGRPDLHVSERELRTWQPWTAAVLGALAALDGPLGDAPPERLLTHFHPLVAGAAVLLTVLRDEADGAAVAWARVVVTDDEVRVPLVNGQWLTVHGLRRVAPEAALSDSWLTALVALAQVTLQTTARWPGLPPTLPPTLRRN